MKQKKTTNKSPFNRCFRWKMSHSGNLALYELESNCLIHIWCGNVILLLVTSQCVFLIVVVVDRGNTSAGETVRLYGIHDVWCFVFRFVFSLILNFAHERRTAVGESDSTWWSRRVNYMNFVKSIELNSIDDKFDRSDHRLLWIVIKLR